MNDVLSRMAINLYAVSMLVVAVTHGVTHLSFWVAFLASCLFMEAAMLKVKYE